MYLMWFDTLSIFIIGHGAEQRMKRKKLFNNNKIRSVRNYNI